MHKIIKYFYLNRKTVKRLDKGLHAVLKYIRNKTVERIIKSTKGKHTIHAKQIFDRHRTALLGSYKVECVDSNKWIIILDSNEYIVEQISNQICCNLVCQFCQICIHMYNCTCPDFLIRAVICKHIHCLILHNGEPATNQANLQNINTQETEHFNIKDVNQHFSLNNKNSHTSVAHEITKNNSHVNVINSLLDMVNNNQSQNNSSFIESSQNHRKTITKQNRFHSTRRKIKKAARQKKPKMDEAKSIKAALLDAKELYISGNSSYDHLY
ncbi:hypothetical protein RI129_002716 [Pyrocoelia pectoralis]|uniref:SWIM-type domain-containing protein n=1 Tax=Pyrocoelia pectoralis TaxID=417401 RepID=A0AAN7VQ57_9COLE